MTKINRITIQGFKSFANKTEFLFDGKYNCVLGPNGSGKSNLGDAICFVLGRLSAKSMRVEKAANLIFNGGKNKKPATNAYVEVAFDNSQKIFPDQNEEVVIKRNVSKDGNSTYIVNGKKRTRTEILDLLGAAKINPQGYNIILQGDITHFVDMGPLDRRKIIEEISDVAVYEDKKHKALLELEKVEEKLNNAEIILKERKTYLKELKKDRDQALQFKELKNNIDSHKASYLHLQIQEKESAKAKFDETISKHQEIINSAQKKMEELKIKVQEAKQNIHQINQEIEKRGEKEQLKVHQNIEELKVELAKDKTRVSTLKEEINKIAQRKEQFKVEIKELEQKASSNVQKQNELQQSLKLKNKELQEVEQKIAEFKKKNKIESSQELEKEIEEKDKLIEHKQEEVQQIRQKQQELLREKDRLEFQINSLNDRIKKVKEVEQQNKEQMKELQQKKSDFKSMTLKLNQCLDQDSGFAAQIGNARKNLIEIQEKQAKLNAKTMSIQASLSSNQAVKNILDNRKKFKGVFGTIAELGQVNKKYSSALETIAGNKMQDLVVDTDETAAECIRYLKNSKLGSAAFIPLNKIKHVEITPEDKKLLKQNGVHDFSLNLISFKPQFQKAFAYIFGNSLVVEDIDTVLKVGVGRIKMTTLDGNISEASGAMRGGFISRKSPLGFKEKDSLEELEKVEEEMEETQKIISNLELKREGNEKEISSLRNRKGELEAEIITLEKTLHLDNADLDASSELKKEMESKLKEVDQTLAAIQKNIVATNKDLADFKTKKQTLRSEINELHNPRLIAQLTAFEEARQNSKEELIHLENDCKNNSLQIEQMIAPEREKIKEIIKQHDKEELQFKQEIQELGTKVKAHEEELVTKEKESKEFYSQYRELFNKREKLTTEVNKSEIEGENELEKIRHQEREINLISLQNAEIKARLAGLGEEFKKFSEMKEIKLISGKKVEELQKEMLKLEGMMGEMSSVNMKALEIYEMVEKEFNSLVEKKDSLEVEKTEVLTFMNEIETKKKEHFMVTFEKANENFQTIFGSLFQKGKAYLQLDNPEKPFEDGLSIQVKLTGNRFMDIKSLSGGEKTLTALSFIFAIQEYQPASFYVLDEIDAALDKQNSETLSKLIRNYADKAQYIVISHNDSIISEADNLFGVSMQEGISKVTSLKI